MPALPGADGTIDPFRLLREADFSATLGLDETVSEAAVFGEGSVRIGSFLTLGAGARAVWVAARTTSAISYAPQVAVDGRRRDRWLLPTASLLMRPGGGVTAYVRYQQGRRPRAIAPVSSLPENRGSERIDVLDAGLRWSSQDGWHASISAQHSRWRQLQLDIFEGFLTFVQGEGGSWDVTSINAMVDGRLGDAIDIDAAVTVNGTRPVDHPAGSPEIGLPDLAGVIGRVGMRWNHRIGRDVQLGIDGSVRYEGSSPAALGTLVVGRQGDYIRTAMTIALDRDASRWSISADNLLDSRDTRYALGSVFRTGQIATPLQPRTIRIGYQRRF